MKYLYVICATSPSKRPAILSNISQYTLKIDHLFAMDAINHLNKAMVSETIGYIATTEKNLSHAIFVKNLSNWHSYSSCIKESILGRRHFLVTIVQNHFHKRMPLEFISLFILEKSLILVRNVINHFHKLQIYTHIKVFTQWKRNTHAINV